MSLLLLSLSLNLETLRDPFINAASLAISIPSSILFIGFPEELTKALVLLAIWRWCKQLPALRAFMFYGMLSGLGFGIQEGVSYVLGPYSAEFAKDQNVAEFLFGILLRLSSLPFFHAMWAGIAAFLIWFAARIPSARRRSHLLGDPHPGDVPRALRRAGQAPCRMGARGGWDEHGAAGNLRRLGRAIRALVRADRGRLRRAAVGRRATARRRFGSPIRPARRGTPEGGPLDGYGTLTDPSPSVTSPLTGSVSISAWRPLATSPRRLFQADR